VTGIGAYSSEGLLERDLDFKAQALNHDNLKGQQGQISAHTKLCKIVSTFKRHILLLELERMIGLTGEIFASVSCVI